jgi:hypothetical protein
MGMDLYGKHPRDKRGEYLRYSVWGWHPLADYVLEKAPRELTGKCRYWHSNDGDGLNAQDSRALADFLTGEIDSGRAEEYVIIHTATVESLPDEVCFICGGSGLRDDEIMKETCNGCRGSGKVCPPESHYPLVLESIIDFRDFLHTCGGFEIY